MIVPTATSFRARAWDRRSPDRLCRLTLRLPPSACMTSGAQHLGCRSRRRPEPIWRSAVPGAANPTWCLGFTGFRGGDIIELLRLGVSGLVQASTNLEADLASAITAIHRGSIWVPESVLLEHAARVRSLMHCQLAPQVGLEPTTLRLTAEGIYR